MPNLEISHVYRQLRRVSVEWNAIGRELGISYDYREELRRRSDLSKEDRLEMILIKWKQSECSEISWDNIINVLKDLEFNDVAKNVMWFLQEDDKAVQMYSWKQKK